MRDKEKHLQRQKEWHLRNPTYAAEKARVWRERNPEKVRSYVQAARPGAEYNLKVRTAVYNLTPQKFQEMLSSQKERCAICSKSISVKTADIDHCHDTGSVRGLLCRSCNMGLGLFRDNPELLRKAIDYLFK